MSWFFRLATSAVQRECQRLRGDKALWRNRALTAERHGALARAQINNQNRIIQEQAAEISNLRHELTRIADALTFVTTERDQALAEKVAAEEQLDACRNWMCEPAKDLRNRLKSTRLGNHELCEQQADREWGEIERLEAELRTLGADLLDAQGRNATLEEQAAFRHNQADRAEAALTHALKRAVLPGQRCDLDDVGQEKRAMDRGDQ